ncbi:MAG: hypothetical protein ACI9A7_000908 [Cyclobacteriaceae bacterium]|jgi:hypothetical protein
MSKQITDTILMVRPVGFELNEQTAVNNYFQTKLPGLSSTQIQAKALNEFDTFVDLLRAEGMTVMVIDDTPVPSTPDSIFPNNWNSSHENGQLFLFPMYAENRRLERRSEIITQLKGQFKVSELIDLSYFENANKYLEGTGSMILDRQNKLIYAAVSERTHPEVTQAFANKIGYQAILFRANQTFNGERKPIYHTNVMMCIGEKFALYCADSIDDIEEKKLVFDSCQNTSKEVVLISESQKDQFAGNMLQLMNQSGERLIVMSQNAFNSLNKEQRETLSNHGKLIYSDINTIEMLGGGSARCMIDEIFLSKN